MSKLTNTAEAEDCFLDNMEWSAIPGVHWYWLSYHFI